MEWTETHDGNGTPSVSSWGRGLLEDLFQRLSLVGGGVVGQGRRMGMVSECPFVRTRSPGVPNLVDESRGSWGRKTWETMGVPTILNTRVDEFMSERRSGPMVIE